MVLKGDSIPMFHFVCYGEIKSQVYGRRQIQVENFSEWKIISGPE